MQYRKFGKMDFMASALGFGTMRLPTYGSEMTGDRLSGNINEEEAIKLIRHAIDQGVNYIDTAYGYHKGKSEVLVGKALKDGYRDKAMLATKSPVWLIKEPNDFDRILDEQLGRLQTDHIDLYLLHSLSNHSWNNVVKKFDVLNHAEAALKAGKIKHLGFSFHGDYDTFVDIIDSYDKWEFCQIQYNYMDIENQAGTKGLKYAGSKGLAVVIMEPLLGGRLANPPKDVQAVLDESGSDRSAADWALQWLWNQPEVTVVLSGMSDYEQVAQNLASANHAAAGSFTQKELSMIDRVRDQYNNRAVIPCTGCSYCMPCPNGVNIPGNFSLYNGSVIHEDVHGAQVSYNNFFNENTRASACVHCKVCESKCPQGIQISDWMTKVNDTLKQA